MKAEISEAFGNYAEYNEDWWVKLNLMRYTVAPISHHSDHLRPKNSIEF